MRIGIFSDTYTPFINGVSTSIVCLKKALEKKGHEVYVVTVNNEKMGYSYDEKEKVMRIPALKAGIYDYRLSMIYSFKAKKKIKELNPLEMTPIYALNILYELKKDIEE